MNFQNRFIGRENDLEVLKKAYDDARNGTARVVALVAESGFGKTRLAQEFYNWLSTEHDGIEGEGYWPDCLLQEKDNLRINPEFLEENAHVSRMPFLWWGLRVADPGQRNATGGSGALVDGLRKLRPHLAIYERELKRESLKRRKITNSGKASADFVLGLGETALEAVAGIGTFGISGIVKSFGSAAFDYRKVTKEIEALDQLDVRPIVSERRQTKNLSELVLADLCRVCKTTPDNFEPIPIVLLVDDAQWLSADGSTASFLEHLMQQARANGWPLLLVLTSWRKEWHESFSVSKVPAVLAQPESGDIVCELSSVAGLSAIIQDAYPGLTPVQIARISEKAEGVPRLLDEVLSFLSRNPKFFEGREFSAAMVDRYLDEVLEKNFADFVADRFNEAPDHVRRSLAIASTQGVNFSTRLVQRVADSLALTDNDIGLCESQTPYGFTVEVNERQYAEFRLRAYQEAALNDLGNLLDEEKVYKELLMALSETARTPSKASDKELTLIFDPSEILCVEESEWMAFAIDAGVEMINRAAFLFDTQSAGEIADRLLSRFGFKANELHWGAIERACDATTEWFGPRRSEVKIRRRIVDQRRVCITEISTAQVRRTLLVALGELGRLVASLEGPSAAWHIFEEAEQIGRKLVEEDPSFGNISDLSISLSNLAGIADVLDGPAAARPLYEEAAQLGRILVDKQPSLKAKRELAVAIGKLGNVVEVLDGSDVARPLREKEEEILRWLVGEDPSPETLRDLAISLDRCGSTNAALEGSAAARPYYEEAEKIMRFLADERPSFQAREDLAAIVFKLAEIIRIVDSPYAALPMVEEVEAIYRALDQEQPSFDTQRKLAIAVVALGNIIQIVDGPVAARLLSVEGVNLTRTLFEKQPTVGNKRELALSLDGLANLTELLENTDEVIPLRYEVAQLMREVAEELSTLISNQEFLLLLNRCANSVQNLNGPLATRLLREELVQLTRSEAEKISGTGGYPNLVIALANLGMVVEATDGVDPARTIFKEAVDLVCSISMSKPGAKPNLVLCLDLLNEMRGMISDPEIVRRIEEEISNLSD